MLFDSPIFLLFLTLIVLVYWRLDWRPQNYLLLGASYVFYGWWDWRFLSLIWISTVVDFFCARAIETSAGQTRRRLLLTASVVLNLSFLGFFKYYDFFATSLHSALSAAGLDVPLPLLNLLLPPGISFYTFQALAYIVDVYAGKLTAARNFTDYALFIAFFPHLIAGPIQRPDHLLPQTQKPRLFSGGQFFAGLQLICWGLFRKCVVADQCGLIANAAFNGQLGPFTLPVVLLGAYAFAWQIYGDFSGYSDIARGAAKLLGFEFMVNFRQPYLATSLQDFWRRWHISLSTWLRDYLYIPLGGNRNGEAQTYRNLLLTMLIGGLWHGANWTFVVWGGIHGLGLALERWWGNGSGRPWLRRLAIFHVVCLAWIFFRAASIGQAFDFLAGLGRWSWRPEFATAASLLAVFGGLMMILDLWLEPGSDEYPAAAFPLSRQVIAALAAVTITLFFTANQANAFIYFQF